MTPLAAMLDELAIAGVHEGFAAERRALAERLLHEGVPADDVEVLAMHCAATVDGRPAAARVLASLLTDPAKRDARLADLRDVEAARRRRLEDRTRAPGDVPRGPGPVQDEPREAWEHDRACRAAWCRVNGDRAPVAVVARELGVSETTLGVMLDRGRVLSQPVLVQPKPASPKAVERAQRESEDRVREFRDRMRTDARTAKAKRTKPEFDWARMSKEQGAILAGIRTAGVVDLGPVIRDPVKRAALAQLEADGQVLRAGDPDLLQRQPYRIAANDEERASFREAMRAWCQQDMRKPRETTA